MKSQQRSCHETSMGRMAITEDEKIAACCHQNNYEPMDNRCFDDGKGDFAV
ncbi:hypothetical protein [Paenibacillus sp. Lou8.1]|uniref:hypothetical protein n=1 Tax=Paenibacillus sp. Lou8.1 TaxID=2962041 RepID=UPI0020B722E4|nr:hypothetical protein [Paenibacillus sp. Lou8.1]